MNGYVLAVSLFETLYELHDGHFLCRSASILRSLLAVVGDTTDIGDANGIGVLPFGVDTAFLDGSSFVNRAIAVDYEMIADVFPAIITSTPSDHLHQSPHRHFLNSVALLI